jgi:hypothetical protein
METLAKRFILFIFISSVPMQLVTAMWLLTVGYFSWFDAIHSEPYGVFTGFCVFFAFFVSVCIPSNDL